METDFDIRFGGPDLPPGNLRNLLSRRIRETPAGGSIDWVTYYLRDRGLARDLVDARRRGVAVGVALAGRPRMARANDAVIDVLSGAAGLGDKLGVVTIPGIPDFLGLAKRPQLHEKLYCFSHPEPVAYIGSFNPSADDPEEAPDVIAVIGDHNAGHNCLVGIKDPTLVEKLARHARELQRRPPGLLYRFGRCAAQDARVGDTRLHFWPRRSAHPVMEFMREFADAGGQRIRVAASHFRARAGIRLLGDLARRGIAVEVITDATLRRASRRGEAALIAAGVTARRYRGAAGYVPMHLKFVLLESPERRAAVVGSFNWTKPSFHLNHELALISEAPALFQSLDERWRVLDRHIVAGGRHA